MTNVDVLQTIRATRGMNAKAAKDQIDLIVQRRNKIAHEADIDPTVPGQRWPIDIADVTKTISFIEGICAAVYLAVTLP